MSKKQITQTKTKRKPNPQSGTQEAKVNLEGRKPGTISRESSARRVRPVADRNAGKETYVAGGKLGPKSTLVGAICRFILIFPGLLVSK
jgi:hypothetical protein